MKVSMIQANTTPRDFKNNVNQIVKGLEIAVTEGADLAVFPELSIPGYSSKDLMYNEYYVEDNLIQLSVIEEVTRVRARNLNVVVGYIDKNRSGLGKPFRNMAAVIKNGLVIATYAKQLLPFYDVFDEGRYFEPGNSLAVIDIQGEKWGICICEDVWNDKGSDDYNYENNPLEKYRQIGVKNIVSINSSPFVVGKPSARMHMLNKSTLNGGTIIYVNQVGGQDDLVFDGHSFISKDGGTYGEPMHTEEFVRTVDLATRPDFSFLPAVIPTGGNDPVEEKNLNDLYEMLVIGTRDYVRKSGFKQVVVGSSGGIDSAVVLSLACDALGPENVNGLRMPSIYSSEGSTVDAEQLHLNLGCNDFLLPIEHVSLTDSFKTHLKIGDGYNPVADENIQARIRGNAVMYFSNALGALPLTTGNKTELALGYCTIYGDMNGGFAPINDLYKMEVYKLARFINQKKGKEIIPESILTKAPSAELRPGQTDEASLLPYPILDQIVRLYIEEYISNYNQFQEIAKIDNWDDKKEYDRMIRMIDINEYKRRQAAPGIKASRIAFGTGRRLPIVKGM